MERLKVLFSKLADELPPAAPPAAAAPPQKEPRHGLLLGAGLGTTAAGLGLLNAGYRMISPEDEKNLTAFTDHAKNWTAGSDPTKMLNEYFQYGGDAVRAKIFGHNTIPFMKFIRSGSWITNPGNRWQPHSADHYLAFQEGPLSAWNQWMKEWPTTIKDRIEQSTASAKATGGINLELGDRLKSLEANTAMAQNPGVMTDFLKSHHLPADVSQIPVEQQQKVWPELRSWMSHNWPMSGSVINDAMNQSTERIPYAGKSYSGLINAVLKLRDVGKATGFGVAGAGLGLTGLYAWKHHQDAKRREQAAMATPEQQLSPT